MGRKKDPDSLRSRGLDRHTKPRVVLHLPVGLYEALRERAKGGSMTAVLVEALRRHLADGRPRKAGPKGKG